MSSSTLESSTAANAIEAVKWVVSYNTRKRKRGGELQKWWTSASEALEGKKLKKLIIHCIFSYGNVDKEDEGDHEDEDKDEQQTNVKHHHEDEDEQYIKDRQRCNAARHDAIQELEVGISKLLEEGGELVIQGTDFLKLFGRTREECSSIPAEDLHILKTYLPCYYHPHHDECSGKTHHDGLKFPNSKGDDRLFFLSDAQREEDLLALKKFEALYCIGAGHEAFPWMSDLVIANLSRIFPSLKHVNFRFDGYEEGFWDGGRFHAFSQGEDPTDEAKQRMGKILTALLSLPSTYGSIQMSLYFAWTHSQPSYIFPKSIKEWKKPDDDDDTLLPIATLQTHAFFQHTVFEDKTAMPDDWYCLFRNIEICDSEFALQDTWGSLLGEFILLPTSQFHQQFKLTFVFKYDGRAEQEYEDEASRLKKFIAESNSSWRLTEGMNYRTRETRFILRPIARAPLS